MYSFYLYDSDVLSFVAVERFT